MTAVKESIDVTKGSAAVWAVMGDPGGIADWLPAILSSPYSDGVRLCDLGGGVEVAERVLEHSDADHFYVYTIVKGGFDVHDYVSRLEVKDVDGGSQVTWSSEFEAGDPDQAGSIAEAFAGLYRMGLESIKNLTEAS
jgi:hypothetical protein